jgi:hypothetical protein
MGTANKFAEPVRAKTSTAEYKTSLDLTENLRLCLHPQIWYIWPQMQSEYRGFIIIIIILFLSI